MFSPCRTVFKKRKAAINVAKLQLQHLDWLERSVSRQESELTASMQIW